MRRLYVILFLGAFFLGSAPLRAEPVTGEELCRQQLTTYKAALDGDVHDADAWTKVRTCVVELKHWNEGTEIADRALHRDANVWQAYLLMGISQLHLKEYETARDALTQASQLKSDQSMPFYYLGMTYLFMHDSQSAVEAGQKAVSLDPANPANYRQLSYAYLFADLRDDCEYTAKKAIELDPNDTAAYKVLSQLYEREGLHTQAEQMAENAIHANGRSASFHPLAPAAVAALPGVSNQGPTGTAPLRHSGGKSSLGSSSEEPKSDAVTECTGQWRRMTTSISRGDTDSALVYFSNYADTRNKYKDSFAKIGIARLQQIFAGFSEPTDCQRIIGVVICKASLEHAGEPGTMVTSEATLRFERNDDGVWRIQSF